MEDIKYAPIGVFDSGVGGLTVAREIMHQLPDEYIIYFGDTARVPYGSKSRETIIRFSRQIVHFLQTKSVKAVVVACNTASALALETLQPELDIPVIGVVVPGARVAAESTKTGKVGVIATESTIASELYTRVIEEQNPRVQVYGKACPLFVPLVEEGWINDLVTLEVARRYLKPLMETGIDTLVMGCTHYPLLRETFRQILGDGVTLVNPAYETARELKDLLEREGIANDGKRVEAGHDPDKTEANAMDPGKTDEEKAVKKYSFYVSDAANKFKEFASTILPFGVDAAQLVHIEDY
ncbi:MAG: glutamate racemase [Clostridiales bacterium]|nr:glutamate racemase [Clostridiales bacterium]